MHGHSKISKFQGLQLGTSCPDDSEISGICRAMQPLRVYGDKRPKLLKSDLIFFSPGDCRPFFHRFKQQQNCCDPDVMIGALHKQHPMRRAIKRVSP